MKDQLPEKRKDLFDAFVRNLSTAIKNSALYASDHPVFSSSVSTFKKSIDKWFIENDDLVVGITPDDLLLDGSSVREKNDIYNKVAKYLHCRGIMALTIMPEAQEKELSGFLTAIKEDDKALRAKGGISKVMPAMPHVKVKALDYSAFLGQATGEVTKEEKDIWKSLCEMSEGAHESALPVSKQEFIAEFLEDTKRSAGTLNKIYRLAMAKLEDNATVEDMRATMARITRYFGQKPGEESVSGKKTIADLISKLDPELVIKIFEEGGPEGEAGELVKEITGDFSDSMLSDFISSMIGGEGGFNENLLKLFDKMIPNGKDAGNVVSMVTDNLLQKNLVDKNALAALKDSIKELVTLHPENNFMSEMYRITVGSFAGEKFGKITQESRLILFTNDLKRKLEESNLHKEHIRLLLNLMWAEKDALEFEKFAQRAAGHYGELVKSADIVSMKEMIEFFTQKLPERIADGRHISGIIDKMSGLFNTGETINSLISTIPNSGDRVLDDIAYMCSRLRPEYKFRLVDAFVAEKDPFNRDKYLYVFSKMGVNISGEITERLECESFTAVSYTHLTLPTKRIV